MTSASTPAVAWSSTELNPDSQALNAWWAAREHWDGRRLEVTDERQLWQEEVESIPDDVRSMLPEPTWSWAIYPWLAAAVVVPDAATTAAVLTSRNYPIISREEQAELACAHLVVVGLSTGRAVAQQLVRLGVGSLHLVDGDTLAPSNTNRLVGTRLTDMNVQKVTSTARELLEFNPHLRISCEAAFLDSEGLNRYLSEHHTTAVIEMIDSFPAKVGIRRAARAHSLPVVMPTDMDWDPMIDIDYPDLPMFGGRLTDADIAVIEDPTTGFAEKTAIAMRVMALERWAPRSYLSGQLARTGLVSYWSQTAPSAAVGGALVARAVLDIVRKSRIPTPRATLSIRDAVGTQDPVDTNEPLYQAMLERVGAFQVPGDVSPDGRPAP